MWTAITGRVDAQYAGAALDQVSAMVGPEVNVPDHTMREAVVRLALTIRNTLGPGEAFGVGYASVKTDIVGFEAQYTSEFMGSVVARSGIKGLLAPWIRRRARLIE